MSVGFWGWNPWGSYGVDALGWNPWGFSPAGTPTAAMVRTLALSQDSVLSMVTKKVASYVPPTSMDDSSSYRLWAFDVRMSLLVCEFLSRVSVTIDHEHRTAAVNCDMGGSVSPLITLAAPTVAEINLGEKGLKSTQDKHPADSANIDALVAQNEGIDSFMLRCVGADPKLNEGRYELARAVSILVNLVCLRLKHAFAVKRPSELDTGIVPMLPVPGHGSFPGGHANMASALAVVVAAVTEGKPYVELKALAAEIALNRVRAGLHYQLDSDAGHELGEKLGAYLVATLIADAGRSNPRERLLPMLGEVWAKAKP